MAHYIDADRLREELNKLRDAQPSTSGLPRKATYEAIGVIQTIDHALSLIDSLQQDEKAVELEMCSQAYWEERGWMMIPPDVTLKGIESLLEQVRKKLRQEQPDKMIQWTGNNLKEVIDFTGKSPRFEEWFKSWEEYENYVHTHNDILKLFFEDGSHYEVPIGAWIIKTPDGYNVPSVAKYIKQEQPEVQNGKFIFPKYLYARTKDNKTIDMSYAPQDMTAVEYIRNDFVEQVQAENEEKIMNFFDAIGDCGFSLHDILLLKNIWKEAGCPPPKSQVADASKMEQPEVDLEELLKTELPDMVIDEDLGLCTCDQFGNQSMTISDIQEIASHFYELGLNARKEVQK